MGYVTFDSLVQFVIMLASVATLIILLISKHK